MVRAPGELFGDYRLLRPLGEGGFAEVYEAEHVHLSGVKVAIKLLKGSFTPQQREELRREALMVSKLDHPHIVQLRTFSIERNIPYLVMAYAQGGTLSQRHPRGTRLTLPEILTYVRPVAAALQYAHEQRIVHRDLKPANLLLTQDGHVQVADFGIAIVSHSSHSKTVQEIAGTLVYMAPEQFRGHAEAASDQYSLAIMVYQWLCGTVPFDGNGNMYLIPDQQKKDPPPSLHARLPDLLPAIEEVIMKALAKDPKERFASIRQFAAALEEASLPPFVAAPGQRMGDYRLVRKLGEGGFAEVYEAEHLHLGTRAAIKLLKGTFTPTQVEGLRQEARAIIQLDHPHIIRAYGFSIEGKVPYLIMAYAHGGSLATQHEYGTPLPLEAICKYVRQIASALHYAHSQNITHRDIKPENILLTQDGRLQVADFGIAIMAQNTQAAQEIIGTWTYMAPEQFTGRAEPASDQYALGIMVYQWLCGAPPFTGTGGIYALPYQHMNEAPPSLRDRLPILSPRIEQVVMKALTKHPAERFASVPAFAQALEEACTRPLIDTTGLTDKESHESRNTGAIWLDTQTSKKQSLSQPSGTTLLTYEHLGVGARSVAWSPDGTRVATGGDDAIVHIWDSATGQALLTLRGHSGSVIAVAWSPDGRLLASASEDKSVQVWEAGTGKLLRKYEGHSSGLGTIAWSPNGNLLASASEDKSVQVWEAGTGKLLRKYEGHSSGLGTIAWSPNGNLLASASRSPSVGSVQVWEAGTGKLLERYGGHSGSVIEVAWSPNGRLLASASQDKTVQVWEAETGRLLRRYKGHSDAVNAVAWSPDGRLLASASGGDNRGYDNSVQVWEAGTGKLLRKYKGHSSGLGTIAWSPDGRLLVSASWDKSVQMWEVGTGKLLRRYGGHSDAVNAVAWSPDGNLLASASGEVLLASASGERSVQVWEAGTGKLLRKYEGHSDAVDAVAWSPDGRLLASASGGRGYDRSVQVWEAGTGKLLRKYKGHSDWVTAVAWSPDGRLLASASGDKSVQVWEAETGNLLRKYEGHSDWVHAVAWSPDKRLLASASQDKTVQVWEVSTGKLLLTYRGHFTAVLDVAWSPDGERIASAGYEVRVWMAPF